LPYARQPAKGDHQRDHLTRCPESSWWHPNADFGRCPASPGAAWPTLVGDCVQHADELAASYPFNGQLHQRRVKQLEIGAALAVQRAQAASFTPQVLLANRLQMRQSIQQELRILEGVLVSLVGERIFVCILVFWFWLWAASPFLIFLAFSNYGWTNSIWYSVQYGVGFDDVQTDAKPTDCDFISAPLGAKGCSYKAHVNVFNADGVLVAGENAPMYGRDTKTGKSTISYDGGKSWVATVFDPKPKSVRVFWVKE
jgi:hypothetical protein